MGKRVMDSQLHPTFLHPNGIKPLLFIARMLGCRPECQNCDRFGRCKAIRVIRRRGPKIDACVCDWRKSILLHKLPFANSSSAPLDTGVVWPQYITPLKS